MKPLKEILGSIKGFFHGILGKISQAIHKVKHKFSERNIQKSFSIVDSIFGKTTGDKKFNKDYERLKDIVTSSKKLSDTLIKTLPGFEKHFPVLNLVSIPVIEEYRKDYQRDPGRDWSEVIYLYPDSKIQGSGSELMIGYDFQESYWFYRDNTYNPPKEYRVADGRFFESLANLFDLNEDELLKVRFDHFKNYFEEKDPRIVSMVELYLITMKKLINKEPSLFVAV